MTACGPITAGTGLCQKLALLALGSALGLFAGTGGALADEKGGGTSCAVRYHVRTVAYTVFDHSSSDNSPAGTILLKKTCRGAVIGTFSAQLTANMHLHELVADCLGTGGIVGGCTKGTVVAAAPAHTLLQSNGAQEVSYPVETVQWVWPDIPSGYWRFRALPAGFAQVTVFYSSFKIEALQAAVP